MKWFNTLSHNRWLEQETDRIFNFGKNAAVPTGLAGWAITVRSERYGHASVDHRPHAARLSVPHPWVVPARINWLSTALMP
jgi:mannose/cellobiose epimerase-like protein (N-acyl-D-glucosamine 2-epimerase family)